MFHVDIERSGRKRSIRQVLAQVSGAIVIGRLEPGVVLREARVELEPTQRLVSNVDLIARAAARRSGGVLPDIWVVGGLRLSIEIEHGQGHGNLLAEELLANADLLAGLTRDESGAGDALKLRLVDAPQIIAVKPAPGAHIELGRIHGCEDEAALGLEHGRAGSSM